MINQTTTRLNKFVSESMNCSRREADKIIEAGNVFINGKRANLGDQVKPSDRVVVNGTKLEHKQKDNFLILALNKPVGIVSTTEVTAKGNIISFVNHSQRIFPVGRLDKDSQGLILLTNNGDLVNKILRAGNKHEKEYVVTVNKPITDQFLTGMTSGVPILGERTRKCVITKETPFIFRIILTQGLNRQIRRMCEFFNYDVVKLERVRIMHITLKGLPLGDWRELDEQEVSSILKLVEKSSSERKSTKATKKPYEGAPKKIYKKKPFTKQTDEGKPEGRLRKAEDRFGKPDTRSGKSESRSGKPEGRSRKTEGRLGKSDTRSEKPEVKSGKPTIRRKPEPTGSKRKVNTSPKPQAASRKGGGVAPKKGKSSRR
jgi:23S rRNA pseudouridine2604 synthase